MSEELEDFIYNAIDHNTRAMPDVKRSLANAIYNKSQAYADECVEKREKEIQKKVFDDLAAAFKQLEK